jgi:hypothetical protein
LQGGENDPLLERLEPNCAALRKEMKEGFEGIRRIVGGCTVSVIVLMIFDTVAH